MGNRLKWQLVVIGVVVFLASPVFAYDIYDNFDSGAYNPAWWGENYCTFDYSCRVVPSPGGLEGYSLLTEFREADCDPNDRPTQGANFALPSLAQTNNWEVWTGFLLYFNENTFGTDSTECVLFGHHGQPDLPLGEAWRSGSGGMSYKSGNLTISTRACLTAIQTCGNKCCDCLELRGQENCEDTVTVPPYEFDHRIYLVPVGQPKMNAWNSFVYVQRYDWDSKDGYVRAWVNGELLYEKTGIYVGYNDVKPGYPKMGNYYDNCAASTPVKIQYWDEYSICEGPDCDICDVIPKGSPVPDGYSCP